MHVGDFRRIRIEGVVHLRARGVGGVDHVRGSFSVAVLLRGILCLRKFVNTSHLPPVYQQSSS